MSAPQPGPTPSDPHPCDALYERTRAKVLHEDDLVHQRMTWMITLHGLLFTAYGFSLSAEAGSLTSIGAASVDQQTAYLKFWQTVGTVRGAMVFVGIVSSVAALIGVIAAYRAIRDDEQKFNAFRQSHPELVYPSMIGRRATNVMGMLSGLLIPFLAGGVWIRISGLLSNWSLTGVGILALILVIAAMWWPSLARAKREKRRKTIPRSSEIPCAFCASAQKEVRLSAV